jgi:hypothetical protein
MKAAISRRLSPRPAVEQLEDRTVPAVTVRLDYTYDTSGFFNDLNRRATLERAANTVASKATDDLAAISPGGVNTWQANFFNPATNSTITLNNPTIQAGEVVVYIGAAPLGSNDELGLTTTGGFSASGSRSWLDNVRSRGQMGVLSNPKSDFSTWGGMITFDSRVNWSFGTSQPTLNQFDFESVALHEMMHIFGFGLGEPAFTRNVRNGVFVGPTVQFVNNGNGVPVTGNPPDHWANGTTYNGQPSPLQPSLRPGEKRQLSTLDFAALNDIGWEIYSVPTSTSPANPQPATPGQSSLESTSSPVVAAQINPAAAVIAPAVTGRFAVGTSNGVIVYGPTGQVLLNSTPFGASYTAGVRVATADFNRDGTPDILVGSGPGISATVRLIDGKTAGQLASISPFESTFVGGVNVTAGDFTGDGVADAVIGADESGGPVVAIYDGAALAQGRVVEVNRFLAIADPNFRGGVRISAGDLNGDRIPELVVAAGFGGGPRISTYNGLTVRTSTPTQLFNDYFAFESSLRNGTYVTVADVDGDGRGDIVVGAGPGGGPRVTTFLGRDLINNRQTQISNFFAESPEARGGVRVASLDLNSDSIPDLITGSGQGGNRVQAYQRGELLKPNPGPGLNLSVTVNSLTGVFVG